MKRSLLLVPVVLLGALLTPGQASADDRTCTGLIRAVSVDGSVIVPQGATCTLRGTRIDGNVFVKARATLKVRGATIGGNIQANDHRRVGVTPRKVGDRIVRTRVEGDIQLEGGARGRVGRTVIGGNLQVEQSRLLQITRRNVIEGDLQAFSNRGGFRIFGNRIDGNLQCKANVPGPIGDNNQVAGSKEDQCRGF